MTVRQGKSKIRRPLRWAFTIARMPSSRRVGRHLALAVIVAGSLAFVFRLGPLGQDPRYHQFADQRAFLGVPNVLNVTSNIAFLLVGLAGLRTCTRRVTEGARTAWLALFAGVALVSLGSAYYHWHPNDQTLLWDRLPMTVGFMGLLAALLSEYLSPALGAAMLVPLLALGSFSVLYWHWSGDLRLYYWVQLIPLVTIPAMMLLYPPRYSRQWLLLVALAWYALAKLSEARDREVFALTSGLVSGHTIKHLLSALGCLTIVWMLQRRNPVSAAAAVR
jgi:hypothetical protein